MNLEQHIEELKKSRYERQIAELEKSKSEWKEKHAYFTKKKIKGAKECTLEIIRISVEIYQLKKKQKTEQLERETNYRAAQMNTCVNECTFSPETFDQDDIDYLHANRKNFYQTAKPTLWQRVKSWFGGV